MQDKKSPKGNLEKKRTTYLIIGFVVVLALVYAGFELFAPSKKPIDLGLLDIVEVPILIDVDVPDTDPTPPPPIEQNREAILNIQENITELEIDLAHLFGQDISQYDEIPDIEPVQHIGEVIDPAPEPVPFPDKMPEPNGGWDAMYVFLKSNLQYPENIRNIGVQGTVLVEFVVERDGSISNVNVKAGVIRDLDNEAMRVVKMMPKWKPGEQMGKTVRCLYSIPIKFTIN